MDSEFDHQLLARNNFAFVNESLLDLLPQDIVAVPVVPKQMRTSAHLMPFLIDLNGLTDDAKSRLLTLLYRSQQEYGMPLLPLLIEAEISASEFARYWNRLQLVTPSPQRRFWLRLHDPRVLHQLLRILSATQWNKFLGPLQGFTYWVGNTWVRAGLEATEATVQPDRASAPWPWHRIHLISIVNRVLCQAGIVHTDLLHEKGAEIEKLTAIATSQFNLSDQADLVEFAVRGLVSSQTFYKHHEIAAAIRPSADPEDDSRLSDRLALISDAIWSEISSLSRITGSLVSGSAV